MVSVNQPLMTNSNECPGAMPGLFGEVTTVTRVSNVISGFARQDSHNAHHAWCVMHVIRSEMFFLDHFPPSCHVWSTAPREHWASWSLWMTVCIMVQKNVANLMIKWEIADVHVHCLGRQQWTQCHVYGTIMLRQTSAWQVLDQTVSHSGVW